ncbi:hypothetical protein AQUCO_10100012v1 [Aquilegia coerulea]|uniref:Glutaredoxin domain-containing protein n=1 Tax=Aquilegia coerulea TaxID=218851 RepID=A0A2G5C401_AQUCA|nr:hypothetical protein AQUCO_10100012v1 [Aquilegia coerulea]
MGCVSSNLLDHNDDFSQLGGGSRLGHHIVSLTSSTYGLLTIDPPQTPTTAPTPPRFGLVSSLYPTLLPEPKSLRSDPEVINSWELMADLDSESSRFSPSPLPITTKISLSSLLHTVSELDCRISKTPQFCFKDNNNNKENSNPNRPVRLGTRVALKNLLSVNDSVKYSLDDFEKLCPPGGENKVVIYTTTLRGVRKTFEACNAVRAAIEGMGVVVNERDVSMHNGYREELKELLMNKGKENGTRVIPPKVFVKGRYIGGVEEVLRINEEGCLGELLEGLPKAKAGVVCEGCGGVGFLPCFECNGSCKVLEEKRRLVIRCGECNENGLVLCPICS